MPGQFYDNALRETYRFPAAAFDTAAVFGRFQGPVGKIGRIEAAQFVITADTTVAVSLITVDTNAGLTTPLSVSVPIDVAGVGGVAADALIAGADELPADTQIEVASDGGATAGDGDFIVTVGWY